MPKKRSDPNDILARRFTARARTVKPRKQRPPGPRYAKPQAQNRRRYGHAGRVRCTTTCDPMPVAAPAFAQGWPVLVFERDSPECRWVVPAVKSPLFYFDETMMRKGLVRFHQPDTFTISGSDRVFKLVAAAQVHRTFHNRNLVVEVRDDLPYRGLP